MSDSVHVVKELGLFRGRFADYVEGMRHVTGANYLFEWPGPLLSMVIVGAPFLLVAGLYDGRAQRSDRMPEIWLSLLLITFGLLFAMRGGLGFLFSYFITTVIRAPARIMPFLSFFAVVAVCETIELVLVNPTRLRKALAAAAAVLLLVGLPREAVPACRPAEKNARKFRVDGVAGEHSGYAEGKGPGGPASHSAASASRLAGGRPPAEIRGIPASTPVSPR